MTELTASANQAAPSHDVRLSNPVRAGRNTRTAPLTAGSGLAPVRDLSGSGTRAIAVSAAQLQW